MRIVFMGNPEFALPALDRVHESAHELVCVVTSPDKPRGRGRKLSPLPVKARALELGVPVESPTSLKDDAFLHTMREMNPDAFVVVAFRILPRALFTIPRCGALNIHPSLLPKGRGPAPIQWTLLRGESETGVSIIQLTEKIDGGGILAQERTKIEESETFGDLHDRLADQGARMIVTVLDQLDRGDTINKIDQDETLVTKAPKLYADDFKLDWTLSARELHNRIRALSPFPGAATRFVGEPFKILRSALTSDSHLAAGELKISGDKLLAGTGDTDLQLLVVKPAGKKAMATDAYLRGVRDLPGNFELD